MPREEIERRVPIGSKVTVKGRLTEATGTFGGVGLDGRGLPVLIVDPDAERLPVIYGLDEVKKLTVIG